MIQLQIRTSGRQSFEDITQRVQQAVTESQVQEGLCHLFCPHTTAQGQPVWKPLSQPTESRRFVWQ